MYLDGWKNFELPDAIVKKLCTGMAMGYVLMGDGNNEELNFLF